MKYIIENQKTVFRVLRYTAIAIAIIIAAIYLPWYVSVLITIPFIGAGFGLLNRNSKKLNKLIDENKKSK